MNELDRKIREALRHEDVELFDEVGGEPSVFEMVAETFKGRHWWLAAMSVVVTLAFLILCIVAAINFFKTEDSREMMLWAIVFIFSMSTISMLKLWFWMEMNKNAVTREIKRLELQIARLATRLKD